MLTLLEAAKLSRNPLTRGILTAIATTDELLSQIVMVPKSGESFRYTREDTLGDTPFYETAPVSDATLGTIGTPADIDESSGTDDQVTVPMRTIVSNLDVSNFAEEQMDDTNQQTAAQLLKKMKSLGRTIGQKLITGNYATTYALSTTPVGTAIPATGAVGPGQDSRRHGPGSLVVDTVSAGTDATFHYRAPGDSRFGAAVAVDADGTYTLTSFNPSKTIKITVTIASITSNSAIEAAVRITPISATEPEWDGLAALVTSGQTITSTGVDGDDLTFEVLDAMINEKVKIRERRVFLMNAKGKTQFNSLVRSLGGSGIETTTLPGVNGPVPSYQGIPILQTDWITSDETKGDNSDLTSIYLVSLDPIEGFYLGVGQKGSSVPVDVDPRTVTIMGVRIREIGQLEVKDAARSRITFYGATALGSVLAVCRATQIKTNTSS